MRIEPATAADLDDLVDAWVDLAATQRRHGSHLRASANGETVRPILAQHVVSGSVLVARRGGREEDGHREAGETGALGETGETVAEFRDGSDGGGANDLIGFVNFGVEEGALESDAARGIVHNLFVEPASRGAGVGSALLSAAESALVERGADVVAIEALWENEAARRLYRRRGYSPHRVQFERTVDGVGDPDDGRDPEVGKSDTNTKDGG